MLGERQGRPSVIHGDACQTRARRPRYVPVVRRYPRGVHIRAGMLRRNSFRLSPVRAYWGHLERPRSVRPVVNSRAFGPCGHTRLKARVRLSDGGGGGIEDRDDRNPTNRIRFHIKLRSLRFNLIRIFLQP